jgi:hypothetical protein
MNQTKMANIRSMLSPRRFFALAALAVLVMVGLVQPLGAQTITQNYGTDVPLQLGMIVGLKQGDLSKVVPLNTDSKEHAHGVVVDSNDSPLSLSGDNGSVFVATSGQHVLLVSTQTGPITAGDLVSLSALGGIAMKADGKVPYVIGKAITSFDGTTGVLSQQTLRDGAGVEKQVAIGKIAFELSVTGNPLIKPREANLPGFMQRVAENIAHKPVSPIRLYASALIALITAVASASMLFGGIRGTMISLGRNPLGKNLIIRNLLRVILFSFIIFISGIIGVYLLLRL